MDAPDRDLDELETFLGSFGVPEVPAGAAERILEPARRACQKSSRESSQESSPETVWDGVWEWLARVLLETRWAVAMTALLLGLNLARDLAPPSLPEIRSVARSEVAVGLEERDLLELGLDHRGCHELDRWFPGSPPAAVWSGEAGSEERPGGARRGAGE